MPFHIVSESDFTSWYPLWLRPPPTGIWFGAGQTEALPTANSAFGTSAKVNSNGIKSFTGGAGDQIESGGVPAEWTNINVETDADYNSVSAPNSVIELPPGLYHLHGIFYGDQTPSTDVHLRVVEIKSGEDETLLVIGTPRQANYLGNASLLHSIYEFKREYLRMENATKFYVRLVNYGLRQSALVGYLQAEKIQ